MTAVLTGIGNAEPIPAGVRKIAVIKAQSLLERHYEKIGAGAHHTAVGAVDWLVNLFD